MELFILLVICFAQNLAIFLDNYCLFNLIVKHVPSKTASLYVKKQQVEFLSRGFLFFTPPLLGFALVEYDLSFLIFVLFITSIFSFFLTSAQSYNFAKKINLKYKFNVTKRFLVLAIFGSLIFSLHLFAPFYLNILAYFFKEQSLWIVQISPSISVFSTLFIVYYLDPIVAKYIDADVNKKKKNSNVIFEMILVRIFGRVLTLIASLVMINTFL